MKPVRVFSVRPEDYAAAKFSDVRFDMSYFFQEIRRTVGATPKRQLPSLCSKASEK